jgi:hypothetical protein
LARAKPAKHVKNAIPKNLGALLGAGAVFVAAGAGAVTGVVLDGKGISVKNFSSSTLNENLDAATTANIVKGEAKANPQLANELDAKTSRAQIEKHNRFGFTTDETLWLIGRNADGHTTLHVKLSLTRSMPFEAPRLKLDYAETPDSRHADLYPDVWTDENLPPQQAKDYRMNGNEVKTLAPAVSALAEIAIGDGMDDAVRFRTVTTSVTASVIATSRNNHG